MVYKKFYLEPPKLSARFWVTTNLPAEAPSYALHFQHILRNLPSPLQLPGCGGNKEERQTYVEMPQGVCTREPEGAFSGSFRVPERFLAPALAVCPFLPSARGRVGQAGGHRRGETLGPAGLNRLNSLSRFSLSQHMMVS